MAAGWLEQPPDADFHVWRDAHDDVLTLTTQEQDLELPALSDADALREWCRELAASREGGLLDVHAAPERSTAQWIYKRLQAPAYVFTGMLVVLRPEGHRVWTVVCGERGMTGVREAVVTAELFQAGALTIERYEDSWAQDPFDPAYRGVDRSVLRFVSDDTTYDDRFPDHPLSKVRRVLAALSSSVGTGGGAATAGEA